MDLDSFGVVNIDRVLLSYSEISLGDGHYISTFLLYIEFALQLFMPPIKGGNVALGSAKVDCLRCERAPVGTVVERDIEDLELGARHTFWAFSAGSSECS